MTTQSLSAVINDLAAGTRSVPVVDAAAPHAVTEFDLFLNIDPLLASLYRQYEEARRQHAQSKKEYGSDSPMADIAEDREDSAWCAMQTRLMELRAQGELMQRVQKNLRLAEQEARRARQDEKDRKALEFYHRMETARLIDKKNKGAVIYEWLIVLMLLQQVLKLPFPSFEMGGSRARAAA